jgi:hypothetical protein
MGNSFKIIIIITKGKEINEVVQQIQELLINIKEKKLLILLGKKNLKEKMKL